MTLTVNGPGKPSHDPRVRAGDPRWPSDRLRVIALIDQDRFCLECLAQAFVAGLAHTTVLPFASARRVLEVGPAGLGLIIYHAHATDVRRSRELRDIVNLHAGLPDIPLVVLTDADETQRSDTARILVEAGALGVVPTGASGIALCVAVIQLVGAGGRFAPSQSEIGSGRREQELFGQDSGARPKLTARQTAVLQHLARGRTNREIALQLGMSESTVKVHVQNIMRRLTATNRTQAVYKARELFPDVNGMDPVES